jgi:hypothetical protein
MNEGKVRSNPAIMPGQALDVIPVVLTLRRLNHPSLSPIRESFKKYITQFLVHFKRSTAVLSYLFKRFG